MKTVIIFRASFSLLNQRIHDAIIEYAQSHDWQIQTVEHLYASLGRRRPPKARARINVRKIFELWHPDGCIVECAGLPIPFANFDFPKTSTVFIDCPPPSAKNRHACIYNDDESIGQLAAKELLRLNLTNFAYVKWSRRTRWSENRGDAFRRIIRQHEKRIFEFTLPDPDSPNDLRKGLTAFVRTLPKPCGIFCANDICGTHIIKTVSDLGVSIPDDIAVVSVDNDEAACEALPVSLTSIEPDWSSLGQMAVRTLDGMMCGHHGVRLHQPFGVRRIVRRASATGMTIPNRLVSEALEFIRTHACNGITPSDVIGKMGCSTSLANLRFREFRKATILDEIHARRIDKAKDLLRTRTLPIDAIAQFCGYSSATDFSRTFKRYEGHSPLQWKMRAVGRITA